MEGADDRILQFDVSQLLSWDKFKCQVEVKNFAVISLQNSGICILAPNMYILVFGSDNKRYIKDTDEIPAAPKTS